MSVMEGLEGKLLLPSGETFEYSMKEKSMASVKVLKHMP